MMIPNAGAIVERMATHGLDTASGLAMQAGVSRTSAGKVLRGEPVSLNVAVKVIAGLGGSADLFDNDRDEVKL